MNKQRLTRFIQKYYLNGTVNSIVLRSSSDNLSARFISGDKTLLGELSLDKSQIEDCEIGVYNTEQLSKLLSVLDDDINVSINKAGEKAISLKVSDAHSSVNYMLSDVSVINKPPQLKQVPDFHVDIDVTPQFINKFIAGNRFTVADIDAYVVLSFSKWIKIDGTHERKHINNWAKKLEKRSSFKKYYNLLSNI